MFKTTNDNANNTGSNHHSSDISKQQDITSDGDASDLNHNVVRTISADFSGEGLCKKGLLGEYLSLKCQRSSQRHR